MGTGLLTDCTGLSLVGRRGFKGLYIERGEHLAGHLCILSTTRGNKGILSLSWLICVLVCLLGCLCVCMKERALCVREKVNVRAVCACKSVWICACHITTDGVLSNI